MDADRFDALSRALVGRRRLTLSAFATGLARLDPAVAKKHKRKHKRKHKHKKAVDCPSDKEPCRGRCIAAGACCTDDDCRFLGECASCQNGKCLPSGQLCVKIYGLCYACNTETKMCEATLEGTTCGPCQKCAGGQCKACRMLGECAGCQDGACVRDDSKCTEAYGPCQECDASFTCKGQGDPCLAGNEIRCCQAETRCCNGVCCTGVCCGGRRNGKCYLEPGFICCADAAGSGCPSYDRCCGEECVDFDNNQEHCGACYHPCLANQRCVDGACSCAAYQAGTKWCESAGRCILEEQICCGKQVCSSPDRCCGSGDAQFCSQSQICPP